MRDWKRWIRGGMEVKGTVGEMQTWAVLFWKPIRDSVDQLFHNHTGLGVMMVLDSVTHFHRESLPCIPYPVFSEVGSCSPQQGPEKNYWFPWTVHRKSWRSQCRVPHWCSQRPGNDPGDANIWASHRDLWGKRLELGEKRDEGSPKGWEKEHLVRTKERPGRG